MPKIITYKATTANMERLGAGDYGSKIFMFSPETHERYSANHADYWNAPKDHVFVDQLGNEMILAIEHCEIRPAGGSK